MSEEAVPLCRHRWVVTGLRVFNDGEPPRQTILGAAGEHSMAVMRCIHCGWLQTVTLPGAWTLKDLDVRMPESEPGLGRSVLPCDGSC